MNANIVKTQKTPKNKIRDVYTLQMNVTYFLENRFNPVLV